MIASNKNNINTKKPNNKRLGMGLSALLGEVEIPSENVTVNTMKDSSLQGYQMININDIVPNLTQPRKIFSESELLELSDSINKNGILQPILVRKIDNQKFEIIAGERRLRASKLAGLKDVPCIVKEVSDKEIFLFAILENIQRENLNPLEEAESYLKLTTEFQYTQDQISEIIHKSRSYIANLIRLTKLPQEVKDMVTEGKLTSGQVRPLLALKSLEQIISLAEIIYENKYSARKVEELVNLILNDEEKLEENSTKIQETKIIQTSQSHSQLIDEFKKQCPFKMKIKPSKKGGGLISIQYNTEEELEQIKNTITGKEEFTLPSKEDEFLKF